MDKKIDEIIQDIESFIKEEERWMEQSMLDHEYYQSKGAIDALQQILKKVKAKKDI